MKRKGFTLIELLAVIVVLAIIALIATPIVLNIIESSKKGSAEQSVISYVKAIENAIVTDMLKQIEYDDEEHAYDEIEVDVKGTRPTNGLYTLEKGIVTTGIFCIEGYVVEYKNEMSEVVKKGCNEEELKVNGSVKLSSYSGKYTYPTSGTIEIIKNTSKGTLSCTSSDTSVADCTINGNEVTVIPGTEEGSATLTITSASTSKYKEAKAAYVVVTAKGTLTEITANGYEEKYDGEGHGITVTSSGATIKYGTTKDNNDNIVYDLDESPKYTEVGEYTVYYQITKTGYNVVNGRKQVIITKADGNVVLSATSGTVYEGTATTFTASDATGALSCETSSEEVATCSISGTTITVSGVSAGTATITVNAAESTNYNATNKTYSITVRTNTILDKAKGLVYTNETCKTDGTTYTYMGGCYIKGANENNYVWYNGFMWRIMGINSDNTVRLITNENVALAPYGSSGTALKFATTKGYIKDWLNDYFYNSLNSTKDIIKSGTYFCSDATTSKSAIRSTCTSGKEITAKVGLISRDEYALSKASSSSYLKIGQNFWTMTPYDSKSVWQVSTSIDNQYTTIGATYARGVRPVINVEPKSAVTKGAGTSSNYYVLVENKDGNKTGSLGENVTSGEYVKLEGKKYRVVSKESDGIKLILDGGVGKTTFGSNNTFTTSSGIGQKLNGDVLTSLGLYTSDKIIETTWYQGDAIDLGFKYTDVLNSTSNGVKAKVGLIRVGEMMSGKSSTMSGVTSYWSINKYTTSTKVWNMEDGYFWDRSVTSTYSIRPVIKVKTDLAISKGNGTPNNPYEV